MPRIRSVTSHRRTGGSKELAGNVEAHVPVVRVAAAAGNLAHRRADRIREIQLEHMTSSPLLNREARVVDSRFEPSDPGGALRDEIHSRSDAKARTQADDEGIVVVSKFLWKAVGVVDPDGFKVERRVCADRTRDDGAERRRLAVLKVIRAVDRGERGDVKRDMGTLSRDTVLSEEFDGLVARAVNPDLAVGHDPETVLEADLRAGIDAEEVAREVAEIARPGAPSAKRPM
jgi:hypothetical protein